MSTSSHNGNILKRVSQVFIDALEAVKNMRKIEIEPLPGRQPSRAFYTALEAVCRLYRKDK